VKPGGALAGRIARGPDRIGIWILASDAIGSDGVADRIVQFESDRALPARFEPEVVFALAGTLRGQEVQSAYVKRLSGLKDVRGCLCVRREHRQRLRRIGELIRRGLGRNRCSAENNEQRENQRA
jgi:hypothetical protein